jgi:hypothetical protein
MFVAGSLFDSGADPILGPYDFFTASPKVLLRLFKDQLRKGRPVVVAALAVHIL